MTTPLDELTEQDQDDVQGNLAGFNKDHQRLVFVTFPDAATGRLFLGALHPELTSAKDVLGFNYLYKTQIILKGESPIALASTDVNVILSFAGLAILNAEGLAFFPEEFQAGMSARAAVNGDIDDSDPKNWLSPFTAEETVHAIVILAGDRPEMLNERTEQVLGIIQASGVVAIGTPQDGNVRPRDQRGHEHFGFKDGISQPSIKGLTRSSKGRSEIATGEFLIGYADQDGHISGRAKAPVNDGSPSYPPVTPPPPTQSMPAWARNGSFVVYRRLQQNVQGFHGFLEVQASTVELDAGQLGAKLVGRWPSGAPLEHVIGEHTDVDPSQADPSIADPTVLHDDHINDFEYQEHDSDGHLMPRAAHIRKSYPRDEEPPGDAEGDRHRILRRGIPYGPELSVQEPPYPGSGQVPDTQDRGLLFVCYQSSIERGFEFIQSRWVNDPDFPQADDGTDPIISQNQSSPSIVIPPGNAHLGLVRWVTTTGGGYFFAPSISAVQLLAGAQQTTAG
jgi:Dyp-type peroxidase family